MELPDLGKHCSESSCKQLDFLPMKCDACKKIFCLEHYTYKEHNCTESYKKDNQVPECPLCNRPIPLLPGQSADTEVGKHIDSDCQSDPAKQRRGKVYKNKCSFQGCKTKEIVPINCDTCHQNYCLRHRMEADHKCKGFQNSGQGISKAGAAAFFRNQSTSQSSSKNAPGSSKPNAKPQQTTLSKMGRDLNQQRLERQAGGSRVTATTVHSMQGTMTEDEAMARALAMSMSVEQSTPTQTSNAPSSDEATRRRQQEEEDAALARALAQSEQEARSGANRMYTVFG